VAVIRTSRRGQFDNAHGGTFMVGSLDFYGFAAIIADLR